MPTAIIVHGGAGAWELQSDRFTTAREACRQAAEAGQAVLQLGGTALEAVEAAVRILEDSPALDAGIGSYPNAEGEVEMDAFIMDGASLALGAVGAVRRLRHPVTLARHVMTGTSHAFLVGSGAEAFADKVGLPRCPNEALLAGETRFQAPAGPDGRPLSPAPGGPLGDTVGAVALDSAGNLAAATSTGGTRAKMPGRVGDSPLVGSGGYADNETAAASATGHGEALMKVVISKLVCDFVAQGMTAQQACQAAIARLQERVHGEGGIIAIDHAGRIGAAFNTNAMPHAWAVGDGPVQVAALPPAPAQAEP